jgi:O-methyltransferase
MFVATIMPHKDKVIICKGSFPETAVGLNEEFVFVSIDVDLFQPTLEALKYFYPRLVKGGAIMIHDYNAPAFPGVKQAVMKYSAEQEFICFPLADECGSLVILK